MQLEHELGQDSPEVVKANVSIVMEHRHETISIDPDIPMALCDVDRQRLENNRVLAEIAERKPGFEPPVVAKFEKPESNTWLYVLDARTMEGAVHPYVLVNSWDRPEGVKPIARGEDPWVIVPPLDIRLMTDEMGSLIAQSHRSHNKVEVTVGAPDDGSIRHLPSAEEIEHDSVEHRSDDRVRAHVANERHQSPALTAEEALAAIDGAHNLDRNSKLEELAWLETMDPASRKAVVDILVHKELNGMPIPDVHGQKRNQRSNQWRLARIYGDDPETAEFMVQHNIVGFHGTRSSSLMGILEDQAILSSYEAQRRGRLVGAGELLNGHGAGDRGIAFSNWAFPDSLADYAKPAKPRTLADLRYQVNDAEEYIAGIESMYRERYGQSIPPGSPAHDRLMTYQAKLKAWQTEAQMVEDDENSPEARLILANFPIMFGLSGNGYDVYDTYIGLDQASTGKDAVGKAIIEYPTGGYDVSSKVDGEFNATDGSVSSIPLVATPRECIPMLREYLARYGKGYNPYIVASEPLT